jgi:glutaredoxin
MNETVILYTTPGCDVCDTAREDLTEEGVAFEERNVMKNKAWFDEALSHSLFVPIVVRNGAVEIGWKGVVG